MGYSFFSNVPCNYSNLLEWPSSENCSDSFERRRQTHFGDFVRDIFESSDDIGVKHARNVVILASVSYLLLLHLNRVLSKDARSASKNFPISFPKQWILGMCDCSRTSFVILCAISIILTLPLTILLLMLAFIYREIVHIDIKRKFKGHFKGFLEGTDALWSLEDDISLSVINVMALIKVPSAASSNEDHSSDILACLRQRISERLLGDFKQFPKLFYKRCKEHGFAFWTDENDFDIELYIRLVPSLGPIDYIDNNREYIEQAFSELSNRHLLFDHTASWEILVSKRTLEECAGASSTFYNPVLIRMHHSLGDGVSLLRFFLEILADESPMLYETLGKFAERKEMYAHNPALAKHSVNQSHTSIKDKLRMLLKSPAALIYQAAFHQIDRNSLHPKKLSGKKVVCWRFEKDADNNLMESIKLIKMRSLGARFTDVILTALSLSLEDHIGAENSVTPDDMTVVHIARFAPEGPTLKLQNRFSVGLQKIPIRSRSCTRAHRFYSQLAKVKEYSQRLRNSPDFFVNYWVISFLTFLLPDRVLAALVDSVHSTVEFSNLPGPEVITCINGYEIGNITFWVPHRGSTGFGLSILSYGQKLQFGLIVDCAVIPECEMAQRVLDRMVDEMRFVASIDKSD